MEPVTPFETKADYVYRVLREEIVAGAIPSGTRLRLAALAEKLHTSEMPVREALRMLQRDGLVEMETHRGAVVARVEWQRVVEAVTVRMHLEVLAVREATPEHTPATLKKMVASLERMDVALSRDDPDGFSEANRRFHMDLYAPAPNRLLKEQIEGLWDLVWRERTRSLFLLDPARARIAQDEHRKMLSAVQSADPVAAAAAAEEHRVNTLKSWHDALSRVEGGQA